MSTWGGGCSRAHSQLLKANLHPWNALQQRLWEWFITNNNGVLGASRAAGIPPDTLRGWFKHKNNTTSSRTLHALAALLKISYEQALNEAGGVTADEKRLEHNRQVMRENWPKPQTPEFFKRQRQAARSPRPRYSTASAAQSLATRRASGALARANAALIAVSRSVKERVRRSLRNYLRWHAQPTRRDIERWAQDTAARLCLSEGVVMALWRPLLQEAGHP